MTRDPDFRPPEGTESSGSPRTVPELLTVIVTTSPTPSAPSTDLLTAVFESFRKHCPSLVQCRVIVVFDTYEYISAHDRLKKGHVTAELAGNYDAYKDRTKALVLREFLGVDASDVKLVESQGTAEFGLPLIGDGRVSEFPVKITQTADERITFMEPSMRLGFALAVRSGLRVTETPYVWVHQHDWVLNLDVPILPILGVMQAHDSSETTPIKYVCLGAGRQISHETLEKVIRYPVLRDVSLQNRGDYSPPGQPDVKVPLTPLFFWHDKPHIASKVHYLARVFPNRLAVPRGTFIEDTIGHRARAEMKAGEWAKWACWLYYPNDGKQACLIHLKGRTWRGVEYSAELMATVKANREGLARLKAVARESKARAAAASKGRPTPDTGSNTDEEDTQLES